MGWIAKVGSPPHPRGIYTGIQRNIAGIRFTPASAGNMSVQTVMDILIEVHPRIRGEYILYYHVHQVTHRFTPASAGNIRQSR